MESKIKNPDALAGAVGAISNQHPLKAEHDKGRADVQVLLSLSMAAFGPDAVAIIFVAALTEIVAEVLT